jgi:hypothetical protein
VLLLRIESIISIDYEPTIVEVCEKLSELPALTVVLAAIFQLCTVF